MPGLPGCRGPVGEGVAAGVAEHVRVGLQVEARAGGGALDHPGESGRGERGSPLADEDKRRRLAFPLEPAQGPELVAAQGMGARGAVLDPTHMQHRRTELDLVPAEVAELGRPKPMPAAALAIAGYRTVQSWPRRVNSRTVSPSRRTISRYPS